MKKIMFNDKYHLTEAVLNGSKTTTRQIATTDDIVKPLKGFLTEAPDCGRACLLDNNMIVAKSLFAVGEIVAVAQSYNALVIKEREKALEICHKIQNAHQRKYFHDIAGTRNKMFVKAEFMPHQIKIKNIRIEHLWDISEEDILKEGIRKTTYKFNGEPPCVRFSYVEEVPQTIGGTWPFACSYDTASAAFAELIDKVKGKGMWDSNPWVFVYDFELVK